MGIFEKSKRGGEVKILLLKWGRGGGVVHIGELIYGRERGLSIAFH